MSNSVKTNTENFTSQLKDYKQQIDEDIADYVESIKRSTVKNYGERSLIAVEPYCDILQVGGKRIRGVLAMVGYQMMNGQDEALILQAARALEMMHAYILVIDDIQDRSTLRRGIATAHTAIAQKHKENGWRDGSDHFGLSIALNGGLIGAHAANLILANLPTDEDLRLKAISIMNHTMMVTAHGQTNDILNEVADDTTPETVEQVLQWKTAHYTVLNPLHMGMVLAGAPCEDTNAITDYALNLGRAFQITDDLLIMDDSQTGKSAGDDIREGKQTVLTMHVFSNGTTEQKDTLQGLLGKPDISDNDINQCRRIFRESGAEAAARLRAQSYIDTAIESLNIHRSRWQPQATQFLEDLASYVIERKS